MRAALVIILSVAILGGCGSKPGDAAQADGPIALGDYRATLTLPGGELPFGLEVARDGGRHALYLENGTERLKVPEVAIEGDTLTARMPGFENHLTAKIDGSRLTGTLVLVKRGGKEQRVPFAARHGVDYRFFDSAAAERADLSGRWAVTFAGEPGDAPSPGVAEFRQEKDIVTGTILTPTGDHRYLAGQVRGNELYLSTFDGAHAYLYVARLTPGGELRGTFWSGLAWREDFVAKRNEAASLDAAPATAMRRDAARLEFTFPDLDGKPVSLSDARFAGKVVVIALSGSWCPNCRDEAAFLEPWYERNRARGLEVLSLQFEHFGDFARAAEAVRLFREDLGISYPTLIAGVSDKDEASKKLPQLDHIYAFPTTIFVDRAGSVRHIHTGFAGPATGAHYEKLVEDFDSLLDQLLAET